MSDIPNETSNDIARRNRVLLLTHDIADLVMDIGARVKELRSELYVSTNDIVDLTFEHMPPKLAEKFAGSQDLIATLIDLFALAAEMPDNPTDAEKSAYFAKMGVVFDQARPELDGIGLGGIAGNLQRSIRALAEEPGLRKSKMEKLIDRLFADAPKLEHADGRPVEDQAPAIECYVILRTLQVPINGVLSKTPEGCLRLMTPTEVLDSETKRTKRVFAEQFFEIEDVVTIALRRDITAASRIVSS